MGRVKITFWGVRGSMAAPGPHTVKYGGNTACVEIEANGTRIICDAGTGIRSLGLDIMKRARKRTQKAFIMLSHLHLDHYIGLPFFNPLYIKRNQFIVGGPGTAGMDFGRALERAMGPPYFPVPYSDIPSSLELRTIRAKPFDVGDIHVEPMKMHHPGGSLGWRFYFPNGRSLVHVTDNEPSTEAMERRTVKWMAGADALIHDAQYTPILYKRHLNWGHSPYTYPLRLAAEAGIPKLYLFHYDPEADDKHLERVLRGARGWIRKRKLKLRCDLSREGTSITL